MTAPKAFVTGASRGIGKAIAVELAKAGYDVAVSARTVAPGEVRDNGVSVGKSDLRPLPGSLQETVAEIEARGRDALMIPMDLIDRASVGAGGQHLLDQWGGVDLLVHNGRYVGPGIFDPFLDIPIDAYPKFFEAHCIAPIILTRMMLPVMLQRGKAQLVNITSMAALRPSGKGVGLGYQVGKAAGNPLPAALHVEFGDQGLQTFNVEPGAVITERNASVSGGFGWDMSKFAPPSAIGAVIAWLVTTPEGSKYVGDPIIHAQELGRENRLHAYWQG